MNKDPRPSEDLAHDRYERLRLLAELYELGQLSHQEFQRLKAEALLGGDASEPTRRAQIELIIVTYVHLGKLEVSLDRLRALSSTRQARIIDAALVSKHDFSTLRIRGISELTRPILVGRASLIGVVCGLLAPLVWLQAEHVGSHLEPSFSYLAELGIDEPDMRSFGATLPQPSASVIILCWSSMADAVVAQFRGFDHLTRRVLSLDVADALTIMLIDENDASRIEPPQQRD